MRNLKRALSLTLASVMLLGMMVVGSSAAAGYDDVKETDNVEAIEVLQTVGIMVGDERGFGPDRPVNRAEMAVVMGLLLNLDYNYYTATCPFNDVYDWARGWVGACAANGIVSGRGDGVYDPGATVTAVEAASMLMRALGYFKYASDYADGFEVSTVRQGTTIGIFKGVGSSATEPMTRNQVAQMVLNTLKSGMVQPDGNTLNYFDNNGNVIATGGKINYVYVTSREAYATAIRDVEATSMGSTNNAPIVELGEQLYDGDLKLYGEGSYRSSREFDVFGRPARRWEYKGQEIGTYVKKELLKQEYTAKVTGQTLYELLGKSVVDNYDFQIAIDGLYTDEVSSTILRGAWFDKNDLFRTNKDAVGRTGNGVLTQVYVDTDFEKNEDYQVYISVINTYLAKANENYDSKDDDVQLKVWRLADSGNTAAHIFAKSNGDKPYEDYTSTDKDSVNVKAKGEDFDLVKDVKEDDLYLVQVADGEIQTMWAPEVLSAVTIDAFKLNDHVTTGGQTYDHATTARYDVEAIEDWTDGLGTINLKDLTYNVILDQYGYLVGLERNENANQYVFLTGLEEGASNLYAKQIDGNIIHLDGTMETVKIDMTRSRCGQPGHTDHRLLTHNVDDAENGYVKKNLSQLNTWCTYTVDANGIYTLTMVPVSTDANPTTTGSNAIKKAQFAQNVADFNDGDSEKVTIEGVKYDTKSINTKRVSLKASTANQYVYGNDNTVYITVSLDKIVVDDDFGGANRWIIDDVDTVATGVKNVDLTAIELGAAKEGFNYPDAEIYTLYDNKGAVIAAVVLGEDEGTTSSYAYIHSKGLEEESYNGSGASKAAGDGKWTWTRKAIVNGVETLLKEVDEQPEYLKPMSKGEWYEIKYDSDGNVRKATLVVATNNEKNAAGDVAKWIAEVVDVEGSVNEYDNVVLLDVTTVNGLTFKNGTLWTNTAQTRGFSVDPDVKVVLTLASKAGAGAASYDQTKREFDGSAFDSTLEGYTGYSGLEQALREMNAEKSDAFELASVQIGAILENGRATSIIINDLNKAPNNRPTSGGNTSSTVTFGNIDIILRNMSSTSNVSGYIGGDGLLYITLPRIDNAKARAAVDSDKYTVTVSVNGAYVGEAKWYSDTATTVTYQFSGMQLSTSNMDIVAVVTPDTIPTEPEVPTDPTAKKITSISYTTSVDLSKLEITDGKQPTVTVTPSDANATAAITWDAANDYTKDGEVKYTITLTAKDGYAFGANALTGTTNADGAKTITVNGTVKVKAPGGGEDPKPPVSTDLAPATYSVSAGTFTPQYYVGGTEPSLETIAAYLGKELGGEAKVTDAANKKITVTKDGVNVILTGQTAKEMVRVFYNDVQIGSVVKTTGGAVSTTIASGTVLVSGDNQKVQGSVKVTAGANTITITSPSKDVYLYDGIEVVITGSSVTLGVKDMAGDGSTGALATTNVVRDGATIYVTGTAVSGTKAGYRQLTIKDHDDLATTPVLATTKAGSYGTLTAGDAIKGTDGKITLEEKSQLYKVTLGGQTKYAAANATAKFTGLPMDAEYTGIYGGAAATTKSFDTLTYTVSASDADVTGEFDITFVQGYQFNVAGSVAEAAVVTDDPDAPNAITAAQYIPAGKTVELTAKNPHALLESKVLGLTLKEVNDDGKCVYTFTMPAADVAADAVKEGLKVAVTVTDNGANGLAKTDGTGTATVAIDVTGIDPVAKASDIKFAWKNDATGTFAGTTPEHLKEFKDLDAPAEAAVTGGKSFTYTLKTDDTAVAAGSYYLEITVGTVSQVVEVKATNA